MRRAPLLAFLLGLWLGGSLVLFAVVAWSFAGIKPALEANERLRERAGFDAASEPALKTSPLWVYAGELNRAYFRGWNAAQCGLAAFSLLLALAGRPRRGALLASLAAAAAIVAALTVHLAPEITARGRALDFVPRDPPPEGLAAFAGLHRLYTGLELAKAALLGLAALLAARERAEKRSWT